MKPRVAPVLGSAWVVWLGTTVVAACTSAAKGDADAGDATTAEAAPPVEDASSLLPSCIEPYSNFFGRGSLPEGHACSPDAGACMITINECDPTTGPGADIGLVNGYRCDCTNGTWSCKVTNPGASVCGCPPPPDGGPGDLPTGSCSPANYECFMAAASPCRCAGDNSYAPYFCTCDAGQWSCVTSGSAPCSCPADAGGSGD
jgi:hypothetical protein